MLNNHVNLNHRSAGTGSRVWVGAWNNMQQAASHTAVNWIQCVAVCTSTVVFAVLRTNCWFFWKVWWAGWWEYWIFFISAYMVVFLFNTVIYVFLLLCLCILIVCVCIFIAPAGALRLSWLRFIRAFSSVVSQMPAQNPEDGAWPTLFQNFCVVLYIVSCRSVYCLRVNVYCTTTTRWPPNCS